MAAPYISKYISYREATASQTATRLGIDNTPTATQLYNMQQVGQQVFDPVREALGVRLAISSFFRCDDLNRAVGGSRSSQHKEGKAIDIDADILGQITNAQVFNYIRDSGLIFDQLIWEYGTEASPAWVHVSFDRARARKEVLRILRRKDGTTATLPFAVSSDSVIP